MMSFKSQTSVAPRVLTSSWRVSWSLFLLLAVALFVLADVLVIRYSCSGSSPPWRRSSSSESKFVKTPVEATAAEIGPLAGGADRKEMMDEAAPDLREMDEAAPDLREMDEAANLGISEEADAREMDAADTRGVDEKGADRLRYPGRKRVLGFVGVQTGFKNRRKRALLHETWFPGTPEEHARVEAALGLAFRFIVGHSASAKEEQLMQAENSTHGNFLRIDVDEGYLNLNHKTRDVLACWQREVPDVRCLLAACNVRCSVDDDVSGSLLAAVMLLPHVPPLCLSPTCCHCASSSRAAIVLLPHVLPLCFFLTLVYFTSLFKLYEADFYIKADDDIYLIPDGDAEDQMLLAALKFCLLLPLSALFPA
ncbi:unnamed protein product [Closterium sp. Naga37s-1]|nr:unnamed protein product [Closterium sp. Naga37s-1]